MQQSNKKINDINTTLKVPPEEIVAFIEMQVLKEHSSILLLQEEIFQPL